MKTASKSMIAAAMLLSVLGVSVTGERDIPFLGAARAEAQSSQLMPEMALGTNSRGDSDGGSIDLVAVSSLGTDASVTEETSHPAAPVADLAVTSSRAHEAQRPGSLTYTYIVRNFGPSSATGARLIVLLYGSVQYGSARPSQGSCAEDRRVLTCHLGTLADDGVATMTLVLTSDGEVPAPNIAFVLSDEVDPNTANNEATEPTPVPRLPGDVLPTFVPPGRPV